MRDDVGMNTRAEGVLMGVLGAGALVLAGLAQTEQLPRNHVIGIRTGATTASDAAWIAGHRASAWSVALAGLILLAAGWWLARSGQPDSSPRIVIWSTWIAVVVVIGIGAVQAHHVATDTAPATSSLEWR